MLVGSQVMEKAKLGVWPSGFHETSVQCHPNHGTKALPALHSLPLSPPKASRDGGGGLKKLRGLKKRASKK